jgi:hypothetical protein
MVSSKKEWSFVLSVFLLLGCGDSNFKKAEKLENLRVIDVLADAPEVSAGDSVVLTPYLSDSAGAGRTLTIEREVCIDLGVNLGATPSCDGNPSRVDLGTTTETPGAAANLYTGSISTSTVTIPSAAVIFSDPTTGSLRSTSAQYNGVSYLFFLTVTAPDGETRTAFKRILVSTRSTKNQNPSFSSVRFGNLLDSDSSLALPTAETSLELVGATNQEESYSSYTDLNSIVTRSEEATALWYATSGSFSVSATDEDGSTKYTPASPSPGLVTFVAILKDGRGGTSIRIITK